MRIEPIGERGKRKVYYWQEAYKILQEENYKVEVPCINGGTLANDDNRLLEHTFIFKLQQNSKTKTKTKRRTKKKIASRETKKVSSVRKRSINHSKKEE